METVFIKSFLEVVTHADLAQMYNPDMEVQVNVHRAEGSKVEVNKLGGKSKNVYTNGTLTWYPIRIPKNAATHPEYEPRELRYPLELYAEGIGMTGWNWEKRQSEWFAFDFDAIIGHSDLHSKKLTEEQLAEITTIVSSIPFVTLRRSTSGRGLHLYIKVKPVPSANHNEHAAMARAMLGSLSGLTGYDFASKVDICGGNMWIWHRKMYLPNQDSVPLIERNKNDGLKLVKEATVLGEVPANWQDHVCVINRKVKKSTPNFVFELKEENPDALFNELMGQRSRVPLDSKHKELIQWLNSQGASWWWDTDNHMMVTHTFHLSEAHTVLKLKGAFKTVATGKERGMDHNCFMFPLPEGAWAVRRFSQGVAEDKSWMQDGKKWTRCFYNREPDLETLSKVYGGKERIKGGYIFNTLTEALAVAKSLGVMVEVPTFFHNRETVITYKDREGKLIIQFAGTDIDDKKLLPEWHFEKKQWQLVRSIKLNVNNDESETGGRYDEILRHIRTQGADAGWVLRKDGTWIIEPAANVNIALRNMGYDPQSVIRIMGGAVWRDWNIVNIPFAPEYPGNRQWNRDAAQLKIAPSLDLDNLKYPHWTMILEHLGKGLNQAVLENKWAIENSITKGSEYLMLWIAAMFQFPDQPSTYLAFWGDQDCGKSIFHEAISQILISRGSMNANIALENQSTFNRELLSAVLCYIEEIDLQSSKHAYNRVKEWVTAPLMQIHEKGKTPYLVPNCTHWVSCTNSPDYIPVGIGDTRITMIHVGPLERTIPKPELMKILLKEAPDFLAELMHLEIPRSNSRLIIPTIETESKARAVDKTKSLLEIFIEQEAFEIPGAMVSADDFHLAMESFLEGKDKAYWTKHRIGRYLPERFPRGRYKSDQKQYYGNISLDPNTPSGPLLRAREVPGSRVTFLEEVTNTKDSINSSKESQVA